jgi:hypothetical protein
MTGSEAESCGTATPRTGSSRSGEMDLEEQELEHDLVEQEAEEKSIVPPASTFPNGGACFPKKSSE